MADTKENILQTALRLFARYGYEATSVSVIAGELGMTKGALYKHYKNKRDIFDCIVKRMYQTDVGRAKEYEVPEEIFEKSPMAYRNTAAGKLRIFIEAQFRFWTEDEFAGNFRKMLILEQYRTPEIADLYHKCLTSGPVSYLEDLFREMSEQGVQNKNTPKQLAIAFYAPFYLLLSFADASDTKREAIKLFTAHIEQFMKDNFGEENEE
jgi:AcrR family transcriptional regulator